MTKPTAARKFPRTDGPIVSIPGLPEVPREKLDELTRAYGSVVATLGGRLGLMREARKITQGELAKLLGRSRATVNQYEAGLIEPPLKMVNKLAEVLEVDPAILAFGEPRPTASSGERVHVTDGGTKTGDYVDLSPRLALKLGMGSLGRELVELTTDSPSFGLHRGDLLFVDTSIDGLKGDGSLYVVRSTAGSLAVVRPEIQVYQAETVRLSFGQGQVSEVDVREVEVVGVVRASLRLE